MIEKLNLPDIHETRKKEVEKKLIFINRTFPQKGHKTWKFNVSKKTLIEFEFTEESKEIHWVKAIEKNYNQNKKKIVIENNCIYFNSLNLKNAIKILKRDYGINYKIKQTEL